MTYLKYNILILLIMAGISGKAVSSTSSSKDSFLKRYTNHPADTANLNRYIRSAMMWVSKSKDIKYLKDYIDSAEMICVEKNLEFPSLLHLARAEYFLKTLDFRSASQEATIAMRKSKNAGETGVLAKTLNFLGRYSFRTQFYMESISYYENSISIAAKNKIKGIIPADYLGMSSVYSRIGNLKDYRNALYKLIEAAAAEKDTLYLETGYWYAGTSYCRDSSGDKDRNFKRADSLLRKSLSVSILKKDTLFISRSLQNLGWNYYLQKDYDQAIEYYNKSLDYSVPAGIYASSDNSLGNLGTIYRDLGQNERSLKYYRKAIDHAKMGDDIYTLWWVYRDMSELYLSDGDTAKAFTTYVVCQKYNDTVQKAESSQGLANARIRYDVDSHNKEVELLSLKLENQKLIIYSASGIFVLSLAVLVLLLSRSKINSKRRISEMNRKISEITQANLRQQMNPHFIFNTLNSIQYYMYQHDKLATNIYLTKFSSLMRKVLENSQHTSIPLRDELDALNLYLELEMIRFKDKFDFNITVDEELDTLLYKVPTMLIQPYVENSICHGIIPGENKGFVKIDLKLENHYILCTIEDNGIGREAAQEKKQNSGNNHNSLGTRIISSRLDLVNALYGTSLTTTYTDLRNGNGEAAGTRVEIQIPILS
jgi:tetratricopeptide (TPR) repeat protein